MWHGNFQLPSPRRLGALTQSTQERELWRVEDAAAAGIEADGELQSQRCGMPLERRAPRGASSSERSTRLTSDSETPSRRADLGLARAGGDPGEAQLSAESLEEPGRLEGRLVELARPVRRHGADRAADALPANYRVVG